MTDPFFCLKTVFNLLTGLTWIEVAPWPRTLLLEPRRLNWTCFLCVIVTKKTVNVTDAPADQLV